jgi:hypothetical protein
VAKTYCILSHSSHSECATDLQDVLKMSISILRGLAAERALLHHVDESWFKFKLPSLMFISGPVLMLALDRAEKTLMHLPVKAINTHRVVDKSVRLIILARIIHCNL